MNKRGIWWFFIVCLALMLCIGCGSKDVEDNSAKIVLSGDGIEGEISYSLLEMSEWGLHSEVYSLINNYPTSKMAVAEGVFLEDILREAGVWDTFQTVKISAADGYNITFTRKQIVDTNRYYFPHLQEKDTADAKKVEFMIASRYTAGTDALEDLEEAAPRLVFGQEYINEHNSVSFVENVSNITVSNDVPQKWEMPGSFPAEGLIQKGDTVKLTHDSFGFVKIFYTIDGSNPDYNSQMYNPSTYQPTLNVPIPIISDTVIKAMAVGYGCSDSDIVNLVFKIK